VLSRAASILFDGPLGARIVGLSHAGSRAAAHWLAEAAYDTSRGVTWTHNAHAAEVHRVATILIRSKAIRKHIRIGCPD
jgi:hypothetical protein